MGKPQRDEFGKFISKKYPRYLEVPKRQYYFVLTMCFIDGILFLALLQSFFPISVANWIQGFAQHLMEY